MHHKDSLTFLFFYKRLWSKVTSAILEDDMDTATAEKTSIEDKQREDTRKRQSEQREFTPKYFNIVSGDQYEFKGISRQVIFI